MLAEKQALIRREVEEGTGAAICLEEDRSGVQTAIRLWFADLERSHSPIVTLRPTGLRRFEAKLTFGNFAADTIRQMRQASAEEVQLARALVASAASSADLKIGNGQTIDDWMIDNGSFTIIAEKRGIESRFDDDSVAETCRELVIPVLAAMAELYGYDPLGEGAPSDQEALTEGAVKLTVVRRRERNPRNRLLCLRIHGATCKICSLSPGQLYGDAGAIIEVHHLQPLSLSGEPRAYDPATDLIPLCPNCHRAVHTRRPVPWTPEELRGKLSSD
ncbi:HNH endonuclease [Tsuneonella sp. YG55]|uniref:HNH endonuclease n=1 Tax=Tsuneonella litorea TaxID=2976475 RepID=A0A9X3ANR5_9SPHN|nr:HNH endonuclease [Tsuneonella litorea]MCT2560072.1 HNH endonuclease [Tsuneonella litorea]